MALEALSEDVFGDEIESQKAPISGILSRLPVVAQKAFKKNGMLGLGESFMRDEWHCASLDTFLFQVFTALDADSAKAPWGQLLRHLTKDWLLNPQIGAGAFEIGREHYDLGNDLFEVMLDRSMTYTCGIWDNTQSLDAAQELKLEMICKKLDLKAGMQVLDIGCGWGNFAHYAASNYGVHVTGLTVSEAQASYARKRCNGLPVSILMQDYQSLDAQFDRIVSIEMIEAVGRKNIGKFFNTVDRMLKPAGRFVLQAISAESFSMKSYALLDQYLIWIIKYIFPNGYLPNLNDLIKPAYSNFRIENWENFGPHYDQTLMAWGDNFNSGWDKIKLNYSEDFKRRWNFYLYGCAALFRARIVQLYQITYSKG